MIEDVEILWGVNRVEVIDSTGRAYVCMDAKNVSVNLQDGRKTLKVFMEGSDAAGARTEPVLEYFVEMTNSFNAMQSIMNTKPFTTVEDAEGYLAAQLWADKALGSTRFTYRILSRPAGGYTEVKRG